MAAQRTANWAWRSFVLAMLLLSMGLAQAALAHAVPASLADNPSPPSQPVRLIFVHHSTGGDWLADPKGGGSYGGLGAALMANNYYVSATNYSWGPDDIGDRTDIVNWTEWFAGPNSTAILTALYNESGQNIGDMGEWPRLAANPGGQNQIILVKSCFPNSNLDGHPGDPPLAEPNDGDYAVANAKAVYLKILTYFATCPDKLFVVITAPPLMQDESSAERAANARAFNNWLVYDWLDAYPHQNVAVFDYYNVLTSNGTASRVDDPETNEEPNDAGWADGNHHRWRNNAIEHGTDVSNNYSAYPSGDSHPSTTGHQKATAEFVPLLNVFYNRWKSSAAPPTATPTHTRTPSATQQAATPTRTHTPTRTVQRTITVRARICLPIILRTWRAPQPIPTRTSTPLPVPGLLQPSDLTYVGAFRLPDGPDEFNWKWSGESLTYYPGGDPQGPADGFPGSLFGSGHNWHQWVSEISIPVPVDSAAKDLEALNTANTLQPFGDIRGGLFPELEQPRVGLEYLPAQGSQSGGRLYFAQMPHLAEGDTGPTHGWCDLTLSNPHTTGTWRIGEYWNYVTGDNLLAIPTDWANSYTGGKSLATGRFRDGGQGSLGPSLFAIAPWQHGNPPAAGSTLDAVPLLLYGNVYNEGSPRMNGYHHSDEWSGGAWLTAGSKSAVIFVGTKGTGNCWYGCRDGTVWPDEPPFPPECPERGWWSTGFVGQMIFCRAADLAAVAQGTMQPSEPQPYTTLDLDPYLYAVSSGQQKSHVGAMAFDRQRGLLYVLEPLVDDDKSIVHVWRVSP